MREAKYWKNPNYVKMYVLIVSIFANHLSMFVISILLCWDDRKKQLQQRVFHTLPRNLGNYTQSVTFLLKLSLTFRKRSEGNDLAQVAVNQPQIFPHPKLAIYIKFAFYNTTNTLIEVMKRKENSIKSILFPSLFSD